MFRKRLIRYGVALLLLGISAYAYAQEYTIEFSPLVRQGLIYFASGELERALAEFSNAIEANPRDYLAYYQRAKVYEQQKYFEFAIEDYTEILKACPRFFLCCRVYYYRGVLYQRKLMHAEAIADYTKIITTRCRSKILLANAYNNRGLSYNRLGKYDKAIYDYNEAIKLAPDLMNVYYNRGCAYANQGLYPLALQDFDKELELSPKSFAVKHYKLALIYYDKKDYYKSWNEVFFLLETGEQVSPLLMEDLKKHRVEAASSDFTAGGVKSSK
jgi:tetratricopeptide (TPR) repeat protein